MTVVDALVALSAGMVAGAYAGLLGVGGGIVMVPAMVLLLDQPQHVAEGTSLLAIVAVAAAAARGHRARGFVLHRQARLLAAGGVAGAALGAVLAVVVINDETTLRRIFGVLLLAVAVRLVLRRPGEGL